MTIRKVLIALACAVGLSGLGLGAAEADTVLLDDAGFVRGTQSFNKSFDLTGPGIVTVSLSNVAWPQSLTNLDFVLSTPTGAVGTPLTAGTEQFQVNGGRIYALWFGQAQGPLNLGVYGLKIDFQPYAPPVVPLPTSILLLLSGLVLVAWQRRQPDFSLGAA